MLMYRPFKKLTVQRHNYIMY